MTLNARDRIGSSPHARGTLQLARLVLVQLTVHPRMRGERAAQSAGGIASGSSPHARGTHVAL